MNIIKSIVVAAAVVLGMAMGASAADKVKVGFVYVGPIGDHGWTYRHDIGRQQVEEAYGDKVETTFVESVPEGPDAERVMRQMARDGVDIIFATSFGYMPSMLKVAKEFPDVAFEHATGYKRADNMATYGLRLYQARHVQGIIAGMMTKTNKICYVAAKANEIKDAIEAGKYFAFTGPLKDNTGKVQLKAGEVADDLHLNTMMYYVEGINATVPGN